MAHTFLSQGTPGSSCVAETSCLDFLETLFFPPYADFF
jgi:hypothetical protein